MSKISIERDHALGLRKAKAAAQKIADELSQAYGLESEWEGNALCFSGSGVNGELTVAKDCVALDVKLGWMLMPFRSRIEETINERFDDYFGA